ncbi:ATP synthase epsilon chain [Chlamydiales bacterium STE3]|nr:ATP synthase epsilon chain [Chlamydiales bacterium STE3]
MMVQLYLATPEKVRYEETVRSLIVPGTSGYFEVLEDHAPIISSLTIGKVVFIDQKGQAWLWATSGGVIEVFKNAVTLLCDTIELATEIDPEQAKRNIQALVKDRESDEVLPKEIQRALLIEKNRIQVREEALSN